VGLLPQQWRNIGITVTLPTIPTLSLGQVLTHSGTINLLTATDQNIDNNTASCSTPIVGAYDPNDKQVFDALGSSIDGPATVEDTLLRYLIRFQNTGTDTAFTVVVRDTLDTDLSVSTFRFIAASHNVEIEFYEERIVHFVFNNILLPDSNVNEPGSNGHIFFRLKLNKSNLNDGSEIINQAGIYFDFNPVIMTDPSVAKVDFSVGIRELATKQGHISLYPNPTASTITIEHQSWAKGTSVVLMDLSGKILLTQPLTATRTELNTNGLPNGMYLYRVVGANGTEGMGKVVLAK
jgi:uncharacterized repeat protein (TIGR01451 family)